MAKIVWRELLLRDNIVVNWKWGLLGLLLLVSLTSCVHKSPFSKEYYFQAMGDPGEIVVTVDTSSPERLIGPLSIADGASFSDLLARVDRLSVNLYTTRPTSDVTVITPEDLSSYDYYGALEGNIPAFLTNSILLWDPSWKKVEEGTTRYYHNDYLGLDVYAPTSGLLLFASDNYMKAYTTTYKQRQTKIPKGLADRMAQALFGFYIGSPQAMLDVGLALPETVLPLIASMVFVIEENKTQSYLLGGIITMKSAKLANTLSILLKSSYIADKRRNKEPLGDMTNLFILQDDVVYINDMELSEEQFASFSTIFGSLASLTTGEKR
ncbi:MAG: hypothetical protein WCS59_07770 [Sphaerochaetaceae bacterium]|nr:hypothetical protein [Sphaerochaetaceae bacterium]MDD4219217.1 hypothetical protein [Sphaerochaetaceae bacterium]MDY0371914.1 hypothetical protein [Sphaerochaetaceae bacterium]